MAPCIVYFERVVYYEDQDNLKRLFFGLLLVLRKELTITAQVFMKHIE